MYGAKYVLLIGVAGSAIISTLTPWIASQNLYLLVVSRITLGAIQSGVFPGTFSLLNKWLTMSEKSIFAPLCKMNFRLGMFAAAILPGLVPEWPNVFYITGAVGLVWSLLWCFFATSEPKDNHWVSEAELAHITKKKIIPSDSGKKQLKKRTPWIEIITNPSVIAFIIIKTTFNFGTLFLTVLVPTYLKYVHHADRQTVSELVYVL